MGISFKGYGENVVTFNADSALTEAGVPVKMTADSTVGKCSANDKFCGICVNLRDGYAAVQIAGYAVFGATSKIAVGYKKLAATAAGKAAVNENGRELAHKAVCNGAPNDVEYYEYRLYAPIYGSNPGLGTLISSYLIESDFFISQGGDGAHSIRIEHTRAYIKVWLNPHENREDGRLGRV